MLRVRWPTCSRQEPASSGFLPLSMSAPLFLPSTAMGSASEDGLGLRGSSLLPSLSFPLPETLSLSDLLDLRGGDLERLDSEPLLELLERDEEPEEEEPEEEEPEAEDEAAMAIFLSYCPVLSSDVYLLDPDRLVVCKY